MASDYTPDAFEALFQPGGVTDAFRQQISGYAGAWRPDTKYPVGSLVTYLNTLYYAPTGAGASTSFVEEQWVDLENDPEAVTNLLADGGTHIFTRTTDPSSAAQNGDIWLAPLS